MANRVIIRYRQGGAGPNLLNGSTATPLTGLLKGSGGNVAAATPDTDYATPDSVAALASSTATALTGKASNTLSNVDPATGREALQTGRYAALLTYCAADTLRDNVNAASGTLTTKWAQPGPLYNYGQWIADACYIVMGLAELGEAADLSDGWEVLATFGHSQNGSTGFIPRYTKPDGTIDTNTNGYSSQWPMIAQATRKLLTADPTSTVAAEVAYQIAKKHHTWWETYRCDASGLAFWGCENFSPTAQKAQEEAAMDRFGYTNDAEIAYATAYSGSSFGHDHCCPVLNSLLVMEADALASLATALGHSADAATYAGKATTRRAAMNALMWDEERGWYQRVLRTDKALSRTTVTSLTGTSLVLNGVGGNYLMVMAGEILVFANGATAQVARNPSHPTGNWQIDPAGSSSAARTVVLRTAPVGVTNGTAVTGRLFAYFCAFPDAALCLHAQIPTAGSSRAKKLIDNCRKVFDGTEPDTTYRFWFSPSYRSDGHIKAGWTKWHLSLSSGTVLGTVLDATSGSVITAHYRDNGTDSYGLHAAITALRDHAFADREQEKARRYRPITATIYFQRSGAGEPTLTMKDYRTVLGDAQTLTLTTALSLPAGTGTPLASTGGEFNNNDVVGTINIGLTGNCYLFGYAITTYPVGYLFDSPYGFITSPRIGGYAYFRPVDDTYSATGDDTYWQPGIWAHFQWHYYEGLVHYGSTVEAAAHARKFLDAWNGCYLESGDVPEYLTGLGKGRGSTKYGWSGAALLMTARAAGLE